uniref:Uncharacterized protein n=1 Tax=Arundo donax TaxID=35708 RepID=A0A0A9E9A1_ARUDO
MHCCEFSSPLLTDSSQMKKPSTYQ